MKTLATEPKIIAMANALRLDYSDPVDSIMTFCRRRVGKMLNNVAQIGSISDFEAIVCDNLNLEIFEVWSDAELQDVSLKYVARGEMVFAALSVQLDDDTYGIIIRLKQKIGGRTAYVAVVDCRGDKAARRFFTRWHEIAHCITEFDQYELLLKRTDSHKKDPIEKLTDMVAAELGFYGPIFKPLLEQKLAVHRRVNFALVEEVRQAYCPDASLQATLNACVSHAEVPVILIEAGLEYKKAERARLNSQQMTLLPERRPTAKLRVRNAISNQAARELGIVVHKNMRVPTGSVVGQVFAAEVDETDAHQQEAIENLSAWTFSDGGALPGFSAHIHARKVGDVVMAIVECI